MADLGKLQTLLAGTSPLGDGPLWLLCLYRFKGLAGRGACRKRFDSLPLAEVGGKRVLRLFDNVCTVCNAGGAVPMWEACTIESYPNPAALGAILAAAPFPTESGLQDLELHCLRGQWGRPAMNKGQGQHRGALDGAIAGRDPRPLPPGALDAAVQLADAKHADAARMRAIMGDVEPFMQYVQDERFGRGRVWQLNLLKLEDNPYYAMYGARASSLISSGATGGEGGIVFGSSAPVWTLRGRVAYDYSATMQYPSREAFLRFAMSQTSSQDDSDGTAAMRGANGGKGRAGAAADMAGGAERHALRTAGLAVQALISLAPDGVVGAFQDPAVPTNISKL
eukprot:g1455.t1